jgi:hypothetical protein
MSTRTAKDAGGRAGPGVGRPVLNPAARTGRGWPGGGALRTEGVRSWAFTGGYLLSQGVLDAAMEGVG